MGEFYINTYRNWFSFFKYLHRFNDDFCTFRHSSVNCGVTLHCCRQFQENIFPGKLQNLTFIYILQIIVTAIIYQAPHWLCWEWATHMVAAQGLLLWKQHVLDITEKCTAGKPLLPLNTDFPPPSVMPPEPQVSEKQKKTQPYEL